MTAVLVDMPDLRIELVEASGDQAVVRLTTAARHVTTTYESTDEENGMRSYTVRLVYGGR